jgi:hypothetical protein
MGKRAVLLLIAVLAASNLLMVGSVFAQSTPTPSAPEFTLKFIPASENITHIDPFTGAETVEIVDKSTIEVKIKNQPFVESINGINYYLFYSVNTKGHFSQYWSEDARYYYSYQNFSKANGPPQNSLEATKDAQYTIVSIGGDYPTGAKIDVYVSAALMYDGQIKFYRYIGDQVGYFVPGVVLGEVSDNSIQTISIPDGAVAQAPSSPSPATTPNQTPTPSPTNYTGVHLTEQEIIIIVAIAVAVIGAGLGLLFYLIKIK